ncbi:Nif11-like leader peptide family natural product precursor [cyanobiont of Ornithocercus magnificus]|nr:Nif11-like leader peptide family natural product precursor [cyanobiont of Ornithocercus magnificus]
MFRNFKVPVSTESEASLGRFVTRCQSDSSLQDTLSTIRELEQLKTLILGIDPTITGLALIPLSQATRPAKIVVGSGILSFGIQWRILRCPGGPLVLQMICDYVSFALWVEGC